MPRTVEFVALEDETDSVRLQIDSGNWWRMAHGGSWMRDGKPSKILVGLHEPGRRGLFRDILRVPEGADHVTCLVRRSASHPEGWDVQVYASEGPAKILSGIVKRKDDVLPQVLRLDEAFEHEIENIMIVQRTMTI